MTSSRTPDLFHLRFRKACELYPEIYHLAEPIDRWFGHFFRMHKKFGSQDRKFLSEALYACFRHRLFAEVSAKSLNLRAHTPAWWEAVVRLSMAREGLMSGVQYPELNLSKKEPLEALSIKESFPLWLVKRWNETFGLRDTQKLCAALNERPPLVIRVNTLKTSRDEFLWQLQKEGFEVHPTPLSPFGIIFKNRLNIFELEEFKAGCFEVQDEGSQMIATRMNPKPTDVVWDVCAGAGGKTLHLAALMKNKGRIIATDIRDGKLHELKKRLKRAGVFNVFTADLDRLSESKVIQKGVDRMLVDAPCSGTGTFRRNPDAKWKVTAEKIQEFQDLQLSILERYHSYLKPGGLLFYATCSLEKEENENVIEIFLKKNPSFRLISKERFSPHAHQTDGFFVACLEKSNLA